MRERLEKLRKKKDGFTLVELIVVLVILAILIGMLVPSLTGYIDKAREKTALLECRQVVLAAQVEASEEYGKGITEVNFNLSEIKEMAEVPGTVDMVTAVAGKITYVRYISTRGIVVIYENGEYRIEGQESGSGGGSGDAGGESGESGGETGGEEPGGENGTENDTNNNPGTAEFVVGEQTFSGIDAEQYFENNRVNGANEVLLPAGAYKIGNKYYYLINGTNYNGTTQSFAGHGVEINLGAKPEPFVYGQGTVTVSNVYVYMGNFYVALPGAGKWETPPTNGGGCWGRIYPQ